MAEVAEVAAEFAVTRHILPATRQNLPGGRHFLPGEAQA